MNILIVIQHNRFTGVNTWAYTLAKHFISDGHTVTFKIIPEEFRPYYLPEMTKFFDYCKVCGITIIPPEVPLDYESFDVIFLSYLFHLNKFSKVKTKKVFVAHGKAMCDGLYDFNFDGKVVGVSQYLTDFIKADYCIPNGVDLDLFSYQSNPVTELKHGLVLSRYFNHFSSELIDIFKQNEIELNFVGNDYTQYEIRDMIYQHDMVIGIGRSAFEGMACGKPVFVSTGKTFCGWVTEKNFQDLLYYNLTYNDNGVLDMQQAIDEVKSYNIFMGDINRNLSEMYLSSNTMYHKYLNIL